MSMTNMLNRSMSICCEDKRLLTLVPGFAKVRCVDDYQSIKDEDEDDVEDDFLEEGPPAPLAVSAAPSTPPPKSSLQSNLIYDSFPSPLIKPERPTFKPTLRVTIKEDLEEEEDEEGNKTPSEGAGKAFLDQLSERISNIPRSPGFGIQPIMPKSPTKPKREVPQVKVEAPSRQAKATPNETSDGKLSNAESMTSLVDDEYGYVITKPRSLSDFYSSPNKLKNVLPQKCFQRLKVRLQLLKESQYSF